MAQRTVAVVGANNDRRKFGNKAVRAFLAAGYRVYPVHPREIEVEGLPAYPSLDQVPAGRLDVVSIYIPPGAVPEVLEQAARREVGEVWLNPGTESPGALRRAEELGLSVVQTCSILAVGGRPDLL